MKISPHHILLILLASALLILPVSATTNLISNPGFETGSMSSWTVNAGALDNIQALAGGHDGSYSCRYYLSTATSGVKYGDISQSVNFDSAGGVLDYWVYDHTGGGAGSTYVNVYADATYLDSFTNPTWSTWVHRTIDISGLGLTGTKTLKFQVGMGSNHYGDFYLDTTDIESVIPTADFTGTPLLGKAPLSVTFTNSDTGETAYDWNFGDGTANSTLPNPTHSFTTAGTSYNIWHKATNIVSESDVEYKLAYITTNATLTADFNGTPTSGTAPLTVNFVDMSAGTPTAWNWSFGDGYVNATKNPVHTYTTAATYTVSLIVTNPDGTDTETKANYIVVSGVVPHSGMAVGGRIYNSVTFAGLETVAMTLTNTTSSWSATTNTNISGYFVFNNMSTSTTDNYVLAGVKSGFLDTSTSFTLTAGEVAATYADKSFGMEPIGSSASQGAGGQYPPHIVRFTVKTWAGEPVPGVNVTAAGFETTAGDWAWLGNLFGFDFVTTPIENTTMTGTTGYDGAIAFWMVETVQYHMTFTKGTINKAFDVYPAQPEYPITDWGTATPDSTTYLKYSITAGALNATYSYINFSFVDTDFKTTEAELTVKRIVNSTTTTTVFSQTFFGAGACNIDESYLFVSHAGYEYIATLHWHNSVFGIDSITKTITIPGRLLDLRLKNTDYYAWISLILIYLIAQMGGAKRVRDVAIIMSLVALACAWWGWLSTPTLLLQGAIFLAALWYARSAEEGQ